MNDLYVMAVLWLRQPAAIGDQLSASFRNKHKEQLKDPSRQSNYRSDSNERLLSNRRRLPRRVLFAVTGTKGLINSVSKKLWRVFRFACRSLKVGFGAPCYLQRYLYRSRTVLLRQRRDRSCAKYCFSMDQPPKPATRYPQGELPAGYCVRSTHTSRRHQLGIDKLLCRLLGEQKPQLMRSCSLLGTELVDERGRGLLPSIGKIKGQPDVLVMTCKKMRLLLPFCKGIAVTKSGASTIVRQLFECAPTGVRDCSQTAPGHVRDSFDCCSTSVRQRFDGPSTTCRSLVEEPSENSRSIVGGVWGQVISSLGEPSKPCGRFVEEPWEKDDAKARSLSASSRTGCRNLLAITRRSNFNRTHTITLKLFPLGFSLLKRITYNLQFKWLFAFSFSLLLLFRSFVLVFKRPHGTWSFLFVLLVAGSMFHVRCANARQQVDNVPAATGVALTDSIKPLQMGDTIPEALWNLPLQAIGSDGKDTAIILSDFNDKKLIILEFWATWCKPCIRSLQRLDSLRQSIGNQNWLVIPVQVYDKADKVAPFLQKWQWPWFSIVDTMALNQLFANYINAFGSVWIKERRLFAIPNLLKSTLSDNRLLLKQALQ